MTMVDTVSQDLRFAVRTCRRSPAFTLAAVLTLSVGIGAATAIATSVDRALWRPVPYPSGERLVHVGHPNDTQPGVAGNVGFATIPDWRTRLSTLDGRLRLAEKSVSETEASLKTLRERADDATKQGKPVPPALNKQITQFEGSLVDGLKSIAQMKKEREDIVARFDNDIERYRKLRAGTLQVGAALDVAPADAGGQ